MNLIFMRHGEAIDNVRGILSDKEIQCSILTDVGIRQVEESAKFLPKIDKIYVSPLIRTLQTAKIVLEKTNSDVFIDDRIREINWGIFSGQKNNSELDRIREMQAKGDFFVRFGVHGENKFDIEIRLCSFLKEVKECNFHNDTILIISHGTVISFMKRILGLKSSHAEKGKFEVFNDVDFTFLDIYRNKLKEIADLKI